MGYLAKRARELLASEIEANLDATRHGRSQDWASYQKLIGWLDGCEAAFAAIEAAERQAGRDDSRSFG